MHKSNISTFKKVAGVFVVIGAIFAIVHFTPTVNAQWFGDNEDCCSGSSWGDVASGTDSGWGDVASGSSNWGDVASGDSNWADVASGDSGWGDVASGYDNWGDVASGDSNWGDIANGDSNWGDVANGDSNWGDVASGDSNWGDVASGDSNWGDVASGDSNWGDIANGDSNWGDVASGDSNWGDVASGDSNWGDIANGDSNWGDVANGDSNWGDVASGDWNWGDVASGTSNWGDIASGDSNWGDVANGDSNWGDVASGDSNWSDIASGNSNWSDIASGNSNWSDIASGNTGWSTIASGTLGTSSILGSGTTAATWAASKGLFAQTAGTSRAPSYSTPSYGSTGGGSSTPSYRSASGGSSAPSYSQPRTQMASASGPVYQTPSYYPAPQQPTPYYPTPTPTPAPQPVMQPTCQISVSQTQINLGDSATIYWTSSNANQAAIEGIGSVQLSGSREIRPALGTRTYTLNVRNSSGKGIQSACTATITVVEEQPTCTLTANPNNVQRGQGVVLSWTTQNATTAGIMGIGQVQLNGSRVVNPLSTTTYTMRALNKSGHEDTCTATVTVDQTIAPNGRCAIYADKQNINRGEVVTLSWAVRGASVANLSGFGQVPLIGTRTISPQNDATYVLGISGNGVNETCSVAVNVNNPIVLGASTTRYQYPEVADEPEPTTVYQRIARTVLPQTVYRYIYSPVVQDVPQQQIVQEQPIVIQQPVQQPVVVQPVVVRPTVVQQPIVRVVRPGVVAGATIEKPVVKIASAVELPLEKVSLAENTTPATGFEDMILPFFLVASVLTALYGARALKGIARIA